MSGIENNVAGVAGVAGGEGGEGVAGGEGGELPVGGVQDNLGSGSGEQQGGARKRKIRLGGEHMNLQPSAPISGQKIRKIKPFAFKTRDQKKYLARLRSSPCRSATQKKCKGRKLRQSCKYARGTKRAFCRRRSNKNYRA
jgi:hypothetical protein